MKKTTLIFAFSLGSLLMNAQTPGSVYEQTELTGNGYVVLKNGDTLKGNLVYWPHKNERMWIQVNPSDKKRTELSPGQVSTFKYYESARKFDALQITHDNGKQDSSFYERINPEHLKFGVYKQFSSNGKIVGGKLEGLESFFILISGHLGITALGSKHLRPMNEKLPTYLTECPTVQQKVLNEQEGYKMPMVMSTDKKITILKKIAEEYESCGK